LIHFSLTAGIAASVKDAQVFGEDIEEVGGNKEQAVPSSAEPSGRGRRTRPVGEGFSRLAAGTRSRPRPKN
jgi:hypothetical protein